MILVGRTEIRSPEVEKHWIVHCLKPHWPFLQRPLAHRLCRAEMCGTRCAEQTHTDTTGLNSPCRLWDASSPLWPRPQCAVALTFERQEIVLASIGTAALRFVLARDRNHYRRLLATRRTNYLSGPDLTLHG